MIFNSCKNVHFGHIFVDVVDCGIVTILGVELLFETLKLLSRVPKVGNIPFFIPNIV